MKYDMVVLQLRTRWEPIQYRVDQPGVPSSHDRRMMSGNGLRNTAGGEIDIHWSWIWISDGTLNELSLTLRSGPEYLLVKRSR